MIQHKQQLEIAFAEIRLVLVLLTLLLMFAQIEHVLEIAQLIIQIPFRILP